MYAGVVTNIIKENWNIQNKSALFQDDIFNLSS